MIDEVRLFLERMKMVVEISRATVLAAAIKDSRFRGKKVVAIISGGNMDFSPLVSTSEFGPNYDLHIILM